MSDTKVYLGKLPTCIFCKQQGNDTSATYDGTTKGGPWAFMCEKHFVQYGIGLGQGIGQRLILVRT